ncbi:MAG: DUF4249 family protein [Bacteroidota bacterium]
MKKNLYRLLFSTFTILTLFACENESISTLNTQTVIVEAYLYAGQTIDSIRITQSNSYASSDTQLITLDRLDILISDGDRSAYLESKDNGYYHLADWLIETEKTYQIQVENPEYAIESQTYVPAQAAVQISEDEVSMQKIEGFPTGGITLPDPIDVTWENNNGDYFYVVINNLEEEPEYVNSFLEDPDSPARQFSFRTEPAVSDFHLINPRRDIQQFGTHQIIVYRVNPEYAALYESTGSTTLSLADPPSNIENGLGIFTGVSSDTVYLEVKKL